MNNRNFYHDLHRIHQENLSILLTTHSSGSVVNYCSSLPATRGPSMSESSGEGRIAKLKSLGNQFKVNTFTQCFA